MIRRRRQARFPAASGAAANDTDALQTDVMRFMSIIGLCLMAVFALVQSIPPQQPVKPLALADLEQQLEQGRLALADLEQVSMQKQQNINELGERLLMTQQQLDDSRQAVAAIRRESLAQAAKVVVEKRPPAKDATKPVIKKTTQPEAVARPVIEKRPSPETVAAAVIRKPPATVPSAKPVPPQEGYSLRFASAAALDRQVAAGNVSLYGMRQQQAWQLSMVAGTPAVTSTAFPTWFHEMSAATVPAHYPRRLRAMLDGGDLSAVVWGVQLPAATRTAIAALLQNQQAKGQSGGALVIQGDGKVTLEQ